MKKWVALILAAVICLGTVGCTAWERTRFAGKILERDGKDLRDLAEQILATGEVPEDAFFTGVEHIEYLAPDWVAFYTGGWGVTPSASYCGFYFSSDNEPKGFQGTDMELVPGDSGWTWQGTEDGNGGGDNRYHTRKIQTAVIKDHWFYFEMFF